MPLLKAKKKNVMLFCTTKNGKKKRYGWERGGMYVCVCVFLLYLFLSFFFSFIYFICFYFISLFSLFYFFFQIGVFCEN